MHFCALYVNEHRSCSAVSNYMPRSKMNRIDRETQRTEKTTAQKNERQTERMKDRMTEQMTKRWKEETE